jgi:hypothetical protein
VQAAPVTGLRSPSRTCCALELGDLRAGGID